MPELIGEAAAGRKQQQHEYLFWELSQQTAVRMGMWKAIQPRKNKPWELYDLSLDLEEKIDLAAKHPDLLEKMKAFAKQAHEPPKEGVFHDRAIHEKDRRAKWGDTRKPKAMGKTESMPQEGLIPGDKMKIVRASSESRFNGKLARNALDGDPTTIWHTQFKDGPAKHPHELVIDLGGEHTVRGFRYLARQDRGWNGAIKGCELYVSATSDGFGDPAAKAVLGKTKKSQEVTCPPVRGRYVMLRALSEINGGPWASAAELGIIGE